MGDVALCAAARQHHVAELRIVYLVAQPVKKLRDLRDKVLFTLFEFLAADFGDRLHLGHGLDAVVYGLAVDLAADVLEALGRPRPVFRRRRGLAARAHDAALLERLLHVLLILPGLFAEGVDIGVGVGKNFILDIQQGLLDLVVCRVFVDVDDAAQVADIRFNDAVEFLAAVLLADRPLDRLNEPRILVRVFVKNFMACDLLGAHAHVVGLHDDLAARPHAAHAHHALTAAHGDRAEHEHRRFAGLTPDALRRFLQFCIPRALRQNRHALGIGSGADTHLGRAYRFEP